MEIRPRKRQNLELGALIHTGSDEVMDRHPEICAHFTGQKEASQGYQDLYVRVLAIIIGGTHVRVKDDHCCLRIRMGQAMYDAKLHRVGGWGEIKTYL